LTLKPALYALIILATTGSSVLSAVLYSWRAQSYRGSTHAAYVSFPHRKPLLATSADHSFPSAASSSLSRTAFLRCVPSSRRPRPVLSICTVIQSYLSLCSSPASSHHRFSGRNSLLVTPRPISSRSSSSFSPSSRRSGRGTSRRTLNGRREGSLKCGTGRGRTRGRCRRWRSRRRRGSEWQAATADVGRGGVVAGRPNGARRGEVQFSFSVLPCILFRQSLKPPSVDVTDRSPVTDAVNSRTAAVQWPEHDERSLLFSAPLQLSLDVSRPGGRKKEQQLRDIV
jgi:hypothetical protein